MKDIVVVDSGKYTEKQIKRNMEKCAEFLARMIQKYGPEILAELEAEKCAEGETSGVARN